MAKLSLPVERMLLVCEYAMSARLVESKVDFYNRINFTITNLSQVLTGRQAFRVEHYTNATNAFNLDANYFLRKTHTKMFYGDKIKPLHVELMELAARAKVEGKTTK